MSFPATILPRPLILHHTDASCLKDLHDIEVDCGVHVKVVGNPENGAYEWLIQRDDRIVHSDCGYGMSAIALRDGLIYYTEAEQLTAHVSEPQTIQRLVRAGIRNFFWRYER